jgi:hypothetical protein
MFHGMFRIVPLCLLSSVPLYAAGTCAQIEGRTFQSIDLRDTGLGLDGPVMGYWKVEFNAGKFRWIHSDVSESGTYTCAGNKITGKGAGGRQTYTGEYFPEQGVLMWMGTKYR